jgi:hypothetical protein
VSKPKPEAVLPDPRLWTEEQVAARLQIHVETLRRERGRLEGLGFPRRDPDLFSLTDAAAVEAWLDRRARLGVSSPGSGFGDPVAAAGRWLEKLHGRTPASGAANDGGDRD